MRARMVSLLAVSGAMWFSCGAKLPKAASVHTPVAMESEMNLDLVQMTRLQEETPVNVGQYMREKNLKWLVLTFGSKGCGICMEKARYFQENLVNNAYAALGESVRGKLELIGVTTDPAASRPELLALVEDEGLSHLSWSDPGHVVMMNYFQPAGKNFSVPLTVMLSPRGIVWRVTSHEKVTPAELIQKIAATVGSDAVPEPPTPPPPTPTPPLTPKLAMERPDRMADVAVTTCADRSQSSLDALLPASDAGLRAVLVHKESCDGNAACENARTALSQWRDDCKNVWSQTCAFRELAVGENLCSTDGSLLLGGGEFFDVFADHFTWGYTPVDSGLGRLRLAEIKGPLTLVFDASGKLVFSKEGAIGDSLLSRMNQDRLAARAAGPDFPVYWNPDPKTGLKGARASDFSEVRSQSKYTMVLFWNTWCSSCTEELAEWHHEPDSGYNFCKSHPDFCQVVAMETMRSESSLSPRDYLDGLLSGSDDFDGWNSHGWTMPLAVDEMPLADGRAPLGWFNGWVRARFQSSEPRTVLYDREGKVVSSWRSLPGEHGPRDLLRKMYEENL